MPRESPKNVGESVRARLLQRSRDGRMDFQVLLTRYALERLLYRLSQSAYRHRFVLKGAMLFAVWVAAPFRPTRDLDLLGYGENSPEAIREAFRAICEQAVADDGVAFDVDGIEATPIREDLEYGGVRVRTCATIAAARIPIQVDVGFGDAITPGAVEIDYPTLLDAPAPHLHAYPIETVVAEKLHALVTRGITNSRLKDFYDLWLISESFELERTPLAAAIRQTFARRNTELPQEEANRIHRILRRDLARAMARIPDTREDDCGARTARLGPRRSRAFPAAAPGSGRRKLELEAARWLGPGSQLIPIE